MRETKNTQLFLISLYCRLKVKSNCLSSPDPSCISTHQHSTLSITTLKHCAPTITHKSVCVCSCVHARPRTWAGGVVLHRSHQAAFSESIWLLKPELQAVCSHSLLPFSHHSRFICQAASGKEKKNKLRALMHLHHQILRKGHQGGFLKKS